jgi:hypothetical protein
VVRRALIFAALLAAAPVVNACGVCVEDKIAAVYDHAVVTRTLEARGVVVFFAIEGAIPPGAAALRKIAAIAASGPAVRKDRRARSVVLNVRKGEAERGHADHDLRHENGLLRARHVGEFLAVCNFDRLIELGLHRELLVTLWRRARDRARHR